MSCHLHYPSCIPFGAVTVVTKTITSGRSGIGQLYTGTESSLRHPGWDKNLGPTLERGESRRRPPHPGPFHCAAR